VSNEDDSISLVPADPKTGRLGEPVPMELDSSFLEAGDGFEIAVGAGRVWAGRESSNLMVMLDPATGEQRGVNPDDIAVAGDTAWVTGFSDKRAVAIDAKTNKVKKVVDLPTDEPRDLAAVGDSAWITLNDEAPLRVGPG
jgi:hypothetical protein